MKNISNLPLPFRLFAFLISGPKETFFHSTFFPREKESKGKNYPKIVLFLLTLTIAILIFSFTFSFNKITVIKEENILARDIFIILDASGSMGSSDPALPQGFSTPLDFARNPVLDLSESFPDDRIGFMFFSDQYRIVNLPDFQFSLRESGILDKERGIRGEGGTDIAKALNFSHLIYQKKPAKSCAIIIISDLGDDSSKFLPKIEEILDAGINVYVMGVIFKDTESHFPNDFDTNSDPLRNEKKIIELSSSFKNFHYSRLEDSAGVEVIKSDILNLEKSEYPMTKKYEITRQITSFGFIALLAIMLFAYLCSFIWVKI